MVPAKHGARAVRDLLADLTQVDGPIANATSLRSTSESTLRHDDLPWPPN
jgi:hypothetical protein